MPALETSIVPWLTQLSSNVFLPSGVSEQGENSLRIYKKKYLEKEEVLKGLEGDFERGYLFSGQIDPEIFDSECTFTDPTLSFKGLSTFERNIASIKPLIDTFIGDSIIVLYAIDFLKSLPDKTLHNNDKNENPNAIVAKWRMSGEIRYLPWRPRIELTGQTRYTLAPKERGGRIFDYFETWNIPTGQALLQLLQPSSVNRNKKLIKNTEETGNNIRTINIPKLKRKLYDLMKDHQASSRSSLLSSEIELVICELEKCATEFGSWKPDEGEKWFLNRRNAKEPISWKLVYTTSKGQSGGNLGPLKGEVYQQILMNGWNESRGNGSGMESGGNKSPKLINRLAFLNSFIRIDADADIVLGNDDIEDDNRKYVKEGTKSHMNDNLQLNFRDTVFFIGNFQIAKVASTGQATLKIVYDDDDLRILRFSFNKGNTDGVESGDDNAREKSSVFVLQREK